jgi:hypothetical protein
MKTDAKVVNDEVLSSTIQFKSFDLLGISHGTIQT